MIVYRSLAEVPSPPPPRALAIGNFDGLHLGHRRIIATLKRESSNRNLPACILTFSPHPEKVFGPARLCMLQTLDQRLEGLCRLGVEEAIVPPFSRTFARLPGEAFAGAILAETLGARLVVVGRDFRFGRDRACGVAELRNLGRACGFAVRAVPPVRHGSRVIGSSWIRDLLEHGRVEAARPLLGRPYAIEGDVVRGRGRGRRLGFPTINIMAPNELLPRGVFVTLLLAGERSYPSVASVGTRPTFGRPSLAVEAHILNFEGDLYGEAVTLSFLAKLRDGKRFRNAAALQGQIARDAAAARAYFRKARHL